MNSVRVGEGTSVDVGIAVGISRAAGVGEGTFVEAGVTVGISTAAGVGEGTSVDAAAIVGTSVAVSVGVAGAVGVSRLMVKTPPQPADSRSIAAKADREAKDLAQAGSENRVLDMGLSPGALRGEFMPIIR